MGIEITGIIPAIVTPFTEDEAVDEGALRAHVRRMLAAGAHGIFPGGTNGEFFAMTGEERLRVLSVVIDEVGGRVPVYAGTGAVTTSETVRLSLAAQEAGADVLSVITPYFAVATQEEIYRHFEAVAKAVSIPVLLYNIPARTGNVIEPATVARLAELPTIAGVKDSSGDRDTLLAYIEQTPDDFAVLCGNDSLILWALTVGGTGSITGIANIHPATMVGIYESWKAGDLAKAGELQDSIAPIRACFRHGNPNTIVKAAVNLAGNPVGPCRAPFNVLSDAAVADITAALEAHTGPS